MSKGIFLSAQWRKLALANYEIDKEILLKYLPPFTELDDWNGRFYVSLVGFMFMDTKLRGFGIPFHVNFEEVNLRFYVKFKEGTIWKRGVVFIKEIVPKPAITFVANTVYKEKYQTLPMKHTWQHTEEALSVAYYWKLRNWNKFAVIASSVCKDMGVGSEEEFITEHFWGYTKLAPNLTSEYQVEHPRWQTYQVREYDIDVDFEANYGEDFAMLNHQTLSSVMLAEGSAINVLKGSKIRF
ncbi:YqjF family protein [Pedobacter sp.]